ncbi:CRISPR-associated endonuclease Cas2 [Fusobacterium sp. PH5-44]|uniref:CRISPR-associated endonuclease Cas2 n=1 Tax=unclassified Fusobacterium TaxID=2648384 RepID=UPI003D243C5F
MKMIVTYDIITNKIRNRIIHLLHDNNFRRMQFSLFVGDISEKKYKILVEKAEKIIDNKNDSLYFFSICEEDFANCECLGKKLNINFMNDKLNFF